MLAKEREKIEQETKEKLAAASDASLVLTQSSSETQTSNSASKAISSSSSAVSYPMSKTGACPYCHSTNVKYIIVVSSSTSDSALPHTLQELLRKDLAFKMEKGEVWDASVGDVMWPSSYLQPKLFLVDVLLQF